MDKEPKIVAFVDLGTNSIRMVLVRINPDLSYKILSKQKEVVRLGEGEFVDQVLQPEAMERTAKICRQLTDFARSRQAVEIVAAATSATREAANQAEFVQLLKDQAGLDIHVVSGKEEARLIYLGVSRGLNLGNRKALFVDIGGGSTETIVGDQNQYDFLETHRLGAIRLASLFFLPNEDGPVDEIRYKVIKNYVSSAMVRTVQSLKDYPLDLVIGSSGTIENLAEVAFRMTHDRDFGRDDTVTLDELSEAIHMLCKLPLEKRREVPGINPYRADIIIPGGAIIETILESLDLKTLRTSERGLLEGMVVDYIDRSDPGHELSGLPIRERSVIHLGRSVHFDEVHARQVADLALDLFDSARSVGMHQLTPHERELLKYTALLHDIGTFISYSNHQAHTYYLLRNSELLGFDEVEVALMATTAMFHRRSAPGKKYPEFTELNEETQEKVRILSLLLSIAESLDRSHANIVRQARFSDPDRKTITLEVFTDGKDCSMEINGLNAHLENFSKVFGKRLEIKPVEPA